MDIAERHAAVVREKKQSRTVFFFMLALICGFVAVFLVERFAFQIDVVSGISMKPTLQDGEAVVVNRLIYRFERPSYGQIIAIHWGTNGIIKRVIGLPGDKIAVHDGLVYRNGKPLDEPYIAANTLGRFGPYQVPKGTVFVLGDNRNQSLDSRMFGPVPMSSIIGEAALVVWPLHNIHALGASAQSGQGGR